MAIKSSSGLLASNNSKHKSEQHFCMSCLQGFRTEIGRDKHFEYCKDNKTVRLEMPKEGLLIKFHDGQYQFYVPFIMYADFEAILEQIEFPNPNPESSYTEFINLHTPSGFCMDSEFAYGEVDNPLKLYRGEDCEEVFCDHISNEARRLYHMFPKKPMKLLTLEQWRKFNRVTTCHICLKGFKLSNPSYPSYHCHGTGKY